MSFAYRIIDTLEGPRYVLFDGEDPIGAPLKEVAICFDKESGTLHKHGNPEYVYEWQLKSQAKLRAGGRFAAEMADDLVVMSGPIPLEELNKMLSITGYCARFFARQGLLSDSLDKGNFDA